MSLSCGSRQGCCAHKPERGVNSAKGPDSSVGGVLVNCPDVDHMKEEVQVSVQVEGKRIGETHGKEQGEEQRVEERTTAQRG